MPRSKNRYYELRDAVISKSPFVNPSELNMFILEYAKVINSKRRCSSVKSLEELIRLLEKRDYVNTDNLKPLMSIINRTGGPQLSRLSSNIDNEESMSNGIYDDFNGRRTSNSTESQSDDFRARTLPDRVLKLVSEEIGRKWRDLARHLGLREGDVNQLEERYPRDLQERVYACLLKFQENNPDCMEQKLLVALERARRNDLRHQVEAILRQH